jgi:hypothetical protein
MAVAAAMHASSMMQRSCERSVDLELSGGTVRARGVESAEALRLLIDRLLRRA